MSHLDVDILRALEDALLDFEGDSNVVWYERNYSDYEADRSQRLGEDADQPRRIKYRRLTQG